MRFIITSKETPQGKLFDGSVHIESKTDLTNTVNRNLLATLAPYWINKTIREQSRLFTITGDDLLNNDWINIEIDNAQRENDIVSGTPDIKPDDEGPSELTEEELEFMKTARGDMGYGPPRRG